MVTILRVPKSDTASGPASAKILAHKHARTRTHGHRHTMHYPNTRTLKISARAYDRPSQLLDAPSIISNQHSDTLRPIVGCSAQSEQTPGNIKTTPKPPFPGTHGHHSYSHHRRSPNRFPKTQKSQALCSEREGGRVYYFLQRRRSISSEALSGGGAIGGTILHRNPQHIFHNFTHVLCTKPKKGMGQKETAWFTATKQLSPMNGRRNQAVKQERLSRPH